MASLTTPRAGLAAVAGPDGRIYAIGGANRSGSPADPVVSLASVEAYDIATNTWAPVPEMPTRSGSVSAVVAKSPDGTPAIYALGGERRLSRWGSALQMYSPKTNTWSTPPDMPADWSILGAAAELDGRIYVLGGTSPGSLEVSAYVPSANLWTTIGPMPAGRFNFAVTAGPDGLIYVIGGTTAAPAYQHDGALQAYNPWERTWTSLPAMPSRPDSFAATTGGDGRIYVVGGVPTNCPPACDTTNLVQVYTPVSSAPLGPALPATDPLAATAGSWTTLAPLPFSHARSAVAFGPDGRLYAFGGADLRRPDGYRPDLLAYSLSLNTWATVGAVPADIGLVTSATSGGDGLIYVLAFIPLDQFSVRTTFAAFAPATGAWTMLPAPPTPGMTDATAVAGRDGHIYVLGGAHCYAVQAYHGPTQGCEDVRTVEAYDPQKSAWVFVARPATTLVTPTATRGDDGLIYVFRSAGGAPPVPVGLDVYDPSVDAWHELSTTVISGSGFRAVSISDGRILLLGGGSGVHSYDPASKTWLPVASLPRAVSDPAVAVGPDGRVYVVGGVDYYLGAIEPNDPVPFALWAYAPTINTVTAQPGQSAEANAPAGLADAGAASCRVILGFHAMHDLVPQIVGDCLDNEQHSPQNGDGLQHTSHGLLVWRKADNFTAFTDGYRTWVNGSQGVRERLNTQRFSWEANPIGLPVVG